MKVDGTVFRPRRLAKQRLELFLACLGIAALIVVGRGYERLLAKPSMKPHAFIYRDSDAIFIPEGWREAQLQQSPHRRLRNLPRRRAHGMARNQPNHPNRFMKKDTKPSEILKALYVASQDRYSAQDIDTRQIASITNVVMKIGEILDEQEKAIQALRIVGGGENEEKR